MSVRQLPGPVHVRQSVRGSQCDAGERQKKQQRAHSLLLEQSSKVAPSRLKSPCLHIVFQSVHEAPAWPDQEAVNAGGGAEEEEEEGLRGHVQEGTIDATKLLNYEFLESL